MEVGVMIESELRVGNWVKTCTPNMEIYIPHLEAQVQGITPIGIFFGDTPQEEGFAIPVRHVIGIPLTEEWMDKMGFMGMRNDFIGGNNWWRTNLSSNFQDGKLNKIWMPDSALNLSHIEFVHQLQNLYFALTGTELTIKP
jgi:hypothetical protein